MGEGSGEHRAFCPRSLALPGSGFMSEIPRICGQLRAKMDLGCQKCRRAPA